MNKDMMKYLVLAGGAYAVYWYITSYGPNGPKSAGFPSYWDTWFGGVPATVPVQSGPVQPVYNPPVGTTPTPPNPQPVITQPSNPPVTPVPTSTVRQQILAASNGNAYISGGYAVPDVWSYYWQQITGKTITPDQMVAAFPPVGNTGIGAPLTLDQFLAGLQGIGLSGLGGMGHIVNTPMAPSIPSLNFGGSFRKPGLRGMGGRGLGPGGVTVQ